MRKKIELSLVTAMSVVAMAHATSAKEISTGDSIKQMFENAKVSGNIRSIYSVFNNDNDRDTYATAVGGQLKYELAKYKGFNGGIVFTTTHDINFASGDRDKGERNSDISSTKGSYTQLTQAYINYEFQDFNLRVGRQLIDTPLADSDDIRMTPDTFEGYTASYKLNDFSFMAGHLNQWQGYDAGLDVNNPWVKMGKDGVNFGGVTFSNDLVEANGWYYNIASGGDANNAIYFDAVGDYTMRDDLEMHAGVQYLKESELDNSGVEANIYGAMGEVASHGLDFTLAYNKSTKESGKHTFSGFGGGTLFTSMDTMILDEITEDRGADAIVGSLSYEIDDFTLLYAYGDFQGDADSSGAKANIIAQNIGVDYAPNDDFTLSTVYVIHDNTEDATSTFFNDKNFRVLASYNF